MAKVKDMTIEDLEHFIEQKLLDIFGDEVLKKFG
jgi:hypothetical protein